VRGNAENAESLRGHGLHGWGGEEQGNEGIAIVFGAPLSSRAMKFSELVRLLEQEGFPLSEGEGFDPLLRESWLSTSDSCRFPWRERSSDRHVPCDLESGRSETKVRES